MKITSQEERERRKRETRDLKSLAVLFGAKTTDQKRGWIEQIRIIEDKRREKC